MQRTVLSRLRGMTMTYTRAFSVRRTVLQCTQQLDYITQACRGLGLGWKYLDGDRLFSVGCHNGHYVIVNPLGVLDGRLEGLLEKLSSRSGKPVYQENFRYPGCLA